VGKGVPLKSIRVGKIERRQVYAVCASFTASRRARADAGVNDFAHRPAAAAGYTISGDG
jgi:hypothetical protein